MGDQFTATLNKLLEEVAERDSSGPRLSSVVNRVLASQNERSSGTGVAVHASRSRYEDWAIGDEELSLRACFAEARRKIAESGDDVLALVAIRRTACKKLHPDVVPRYFIDEAEDLMKTLNSLISSARKTS